MAIDLSSPEVIQLFSQSRLSQKIIPYLALGVGIVVTLTMLVLFFYLLVWGLLMGVVLYAIVWIRRAFIKKRVQPAKIQGQTYDHDDSVS